MNRGQEAKKGSTPTQSDELDALMQKYQLDRKKRFAGMQKNAAMLAESQRRAYAQQQSDEQEMYERAVEAMNRAPKTTPPSNEDLNALLPAPAANAPVMSPNYGNEFDVSPATYSQGKDYRAAAVSLAKKYNIPVNVFTAMIGKESSYDPTAKSSKGAYGLAQLMPATAKELGVDPRDPMQNLEGGARYLRQQIDRFGSIPLALAAYNAGPGDVLKYKGIPPYQETQDYVKKIMHRAGYADGGEVHMEKGGSMREKMLANLAGAQAIAPDVPLNYVKPETVYDLVNKYSPPTLAAKGVKAAYEAAPESVQNFVSGIGQTGGELVQAALADPYEGAVLRGIGSVLTATPKMPEGYIGGSPLENPMANMETGPLQAMFIPLGKLVQKGMVPREAITLAEKLMASGVPQEEIWQTVGRKYGFPAAKAPGHGDMWVTEIPDAGIQYTPGKIGASKEVPLSEIISHPELEKGVPEVFQAPAMYREPKGMKNQGEAFLAEGSIHVNPDIAALPESKLKTLLHELQHQVANKTGMEKGADYHNRLYQALLDAGLPEPMAYEQAHKIWAADPGEYLAELTSARSNLSQSQRIEQFPFGVDYSKQTVGVGPWEVNKPEQTELDALVRRYSGVTAPIKKAIESGKGLSSAVSDLSRETRKTLRSAAKELGYSNNEWSFPYIDIINEGKQPPVGRIESWLDVADHVSKTNPTPELDKAIAAGRSYLETLFSQGAPIMKAKGGPVHMADGGNPFKERLMSTLAGQSDMGSDVVAGSGYTPTLPEQVAKYVKSEGSETPWSTGSLSAFNKGLADAAGAPVDLVNMAIGTRWPDLTSEEPVMGSKWLRKKTEDYGLADTQDRGLLELPSGFIDPYAGVGAIAGHVAPVVASAPIFFSRLGRAIEGASPKAFTTGRSATEWLMSNLGKYSKAEVEATGLADRLAQMGKTSKEEVLGIVNEGQPQTIETWKGSPENPAKYDPANPVYKDLTLPGYENYRELTFQFPENKSKLIEEAYRTEEKSIRNAIAEESAIMGDGDFTPRMEELYRQLADLNKRQKAVTQNAGIFTKGHFEPNTWGHVRMTDRTDAEGKKVLFVEELQSDWSRAGKERGFGRKDIKLDETDPEAIGGYNFILPDGDKVTGFGKTVDEAKEDVYRVFKQSLVSDVPKAPYVTDLGQWTEQGIKHIMHHAAEQGYDKVAFINGEQTVQRYGDAVRQNVGSVLAQKNPNGTFKIGLKSSDASEASAYRTEIGGTSLAAVKEEELENVVGKELAEKIKAGEGFSFNPLNNAEQAVYSDQDIQVGGKGLKRLYDETIPASLKRVLKPLGGKTEIMDVGQGMPQLGFTITPKMRNSILTKGQQSFKKGGSVHGFKNGDSVDYSKLFPASKGAPASSTGTSRTQPDVRVAPAAVPKKTIGEMLDFYLNPMNAVGGMASSAYHVVPDIAQYTEPVAEFLSQKPKGDYVSLSVADNPIIMSATPAPIGRFANLTETQIRGLMKADFAAAKANELEWAALKRFHPEHAEAMMQDARAEFGFHPEANLDEVMPSIYAEKKAQFGAPAATESSMTVLEENEARKAALKSRLLPQAEAKQEAFEQEKWANTWRRIKEDDPAYAKKLQKQAKKDIGVNDDEAMSRYLRLPNVELAKGGKVSFKDLRMKYAKQKTR